MIVQDHGCYVQQLACEPLRFSARTIAVVSAEGDGDGRRDGSNRGGEGKMDEEGLILSPPGTRRVVISWPAQSCRWLRALATC